MTACSPPHSPPRRSRSPSRCELYPELARFSELYDLDAPVFRSTWALVLEPSQAGGPPNLIDRLSAEIRGRKVTELTVSPYGAGD